MVKSEIIQILRDGENGKIRQVFRDGGSINYFKINKKYDDPIEY